MAKFISFDLPAFYHRDGLTEEISSRIEKAVSWNTPYQEAVPDEWKQKAVQMVFDQTEGFLKQDGVHWVEDTLRIKVPEDSDGVLDDEQMLDDFVKDKIAEMSTHMDTATILVASSLNSFITLGFPPLETSAA